jgi:ABC-type glycerol-3-phosphate transport system substrate-binding protein
VTSAPRLRPGAPARRRRRCRLAVAAALAAASCSGPTLAPDATVQVTTLDRCPGAAGARDRLTVWQPFVGDGGIVQRQVIDEAVAGYRAGHPEVDVVIEAVEPREQVARLSALPPDEAPDLVLAETTDLARLADSGRTVPAQPCLEAVGGPLPERFWPSVRRAWTAQGQLWAVPWAASVPVLWYNQLRLRAADQAVPTTRAELEAALVHLHDRAGRPDMRYDLDLAFVLAERWSAQRGQPLFDRDAAGRPRAHLDRPEVLDDLLWLRDLDRRGLIMSPGADAGTDDVLALADQAEPTTLAVHTSTGVGYALWLMDRGMLDPDLGGLAPVPAPGPAARSEPLPEGYAFVLMAGPHADPRRATTLAAALAQPAVQAAMAARTGLAPVVPGVEREPPLADALVRRPPLRVALDAVARAAAPEGTDPVRPGPYGDLRQIVIDAYRAMLGPGDAATALHGAQQAATRLLERYESAHGR